MGNKGYAASLRAVESQQSIRARERVDSVAHDGLNVGVQKVKGEIRTKKMNSSSGTPSILLTLVCGREVEILGREEDGDREKRECRVGGGGLVGMEEGREGDEVKNKGSRKAWARFRRLIKVR